MSERIVVDASVIVKWVAAEPGRVGALELLDRFESGDVDLVAPPIVIIEVASALSKKVRRKTMTAAEGDTALAFARRRRPVFVQLPNAVKRAFRLSVANQMSLWDSFYLDLAIESRLDLVTSDARFASVALKSYPYVRLLPE